ncbi:hypothetical protein [Rhizobium halophytocola]|uniref:Uncharacterized protein n=1 Tax=Rhizobium halophytocola TaxID=735519 RepID=A0ABS4E3I1_9HYPH|nr:hypothetical protein [Rhizobium halophytocola]MBP1852509.1 hypothetical protein [Rhizobium halophytocola]
MYLELHADAANRASFPDCQISSFVASERQISFRSDGIFVEGIGFIGPDVDVRCSISGPVQLREYADGAWGDIELDTLVGLREICEWNVNNGNLTFAGFEAVSGLWAEYRVSSFSMDVSVSYE